MAIEITCRKYAITTSGIEVVPSFVIQPIPGKPITDDVLAQIEAGLNELIKEMEQTLGEETRPMTDEEIEAYKEGESADNDVVSVS